MSEFFYQSLLNFSANSVSETFLWIMSIVFLFAVFLRILNRAQLFVDNVPALLTSLGILGTFVGIIIGLMHFDTSQIDSSVTNLLEGLKTAFITSVYGIALSVIAKIATRCFRFPFDGKDEVISPVEYLESLNSIERAVVKTREQQRQFASEVGQSIVGELNGVVERFNERLNTQFGDGLKAFGDRFHGLEEALGSFTESFNGFVKNAKHLSEESSLNAATMLEIGEKLHSLNNKFGDYFSYMENLFELVHKSNEQFSELNEKLLDYSNRSMQAINYIPEMNTKIEKFNDNIGKLAKIADETINESLVALSTQSKNLGEHISKVSTAFEDVSNIEVSFIQDFIQKGASVHQSAVQDITDKQIQLHNNMVNSLSEVINSSFAKLEMNISKQQSSIEQRMEGEIDQVMASMGQALAAISGQFTRDYHQLINQMQRVLERANEVA